MTQLAATNRSAFQFSIEVEDAIHFAQGRCRAAPIFFLWAGHRITMKTMNQLAAINRGAFRLKMRSMLRKVFAAQRRIFFRNWQPNRNEDQEKTELAPINRRTFRLKRKSILRKLVAAQRRFFFRNWQLWCIASPWEEAIKIFWHELCAAQRQFFFSGKRAGPP